MPRALLVDDNDAAVNLMPVSQATTSIIPDAALSEAYLV